MFPPTTTSSPIPVSKVTPPETESQKATAFATTQIDKPQAPEKNATMVAATQSKSDALRSLLDDLASPDSARRATAATALGRLADVAAVPALIAALGESDADIAREAATSLGLLHNAAAVEPLIAILKNHDGYFHSVVRAAAARSLGQLRDLRAVVPLIAAIKDPIAEASAEAIRALASLPDPRALPALLEVIRNEHGFYLATARYAAILGLAHIGGEQAICELRFVSTNQWEDAVIRAAAIDALRPATATASTVNT
jgi:HEAT repeat protein